ncbi:MAG TPA: MarR family transcriptional regulator [Dehalococcoidia bacterium]|nr:MarR family transcriptional regulator [Dehalococcoidia bacterium]
MTQTRQEVPAGRSRALQMAVESYIRAFPEADADALATHLTLAAAAEPIARAIEARIQALGFDLTRQRYTVVRMLYLSPEQALAQGEIAQALGVSGANVTQLLDALAVDGWIRREASTVDRRVTYAKLTEEGKERCAVLVPAIMELMMDSCSTLSKEERAELRRLVRKVIERVEPPNEA